MKWQYLLAAGHADTDGAGPTGPSQGCEDRAQTIEVDLGHR